jgi:hypothetical protein
MTLLRALISAFFCLAGASAVAQPLTPAELEGIVKSYPFTPVFEVNGVRLLAEPVLYTKALVLHPGSVLGLTAVGSDRIIIVTDELVLTNSPLEHQSRIEFVGVYKERPLVNPDGADGTNGLTGRNGPGAGWNGDPGTPGGPGLDGITIRRPDVYIIAFDVRWATDRDEEDFSNLTIQLTGVRGGNGGKGGDGGDGGYGAQGQKSKFIKLRCRGAGPGGSGGDGAIGGDGGDGAPSGDGANFYIGGSDDALRRLVSLTVFNDGGDPPGIGGAKGAPGVGRPKGPWGAEIFGCSRRFVPAPGPRDGENARDVAIPGVDATERGKMGIQDQIEGIDRGSFF